MALRISVFVLSLLVLLSISTLQPTEAVINGRTADIGEFPFAVDIRNASDSMPYCAGTLVTRRHIVTAIICVTTTEHLLIDSHPTFLPLKHLKVYVGSVDARRGVLYEVEKVYGHPDYNVNVTIAWNNLAVIKLKNEVEVDVASLPTVNPKVGQTVEVAGWGYTDTKQQNPATKLQKFTLRVIDTNECKHKWELALGDDFLMIHKYIESDRVFCAVPVVKGSSVGFGDLGDTAVVDGQYVGFLLLAKLDDDTIPSLFLAVAGYKDFIEKVIKDN